MFPSRTNWIASRCAGLDRAWVPAWQTRPYFTRASSMRRPSVRLWLTGFSTYTSLPACIAQIDASACQWLGVAIDTACGKLGAFIKARPDKQPDAE